MAEWTRQSNADADRLGGGDGVRYFKIEGLAQNTPSPALNLAGAHKVYFYAGVSTAMYAYDPISDVTRTFSAAGESGVSGDASSTKPGFWIDPPALVKVAHGNAAAQDIVVEVHYPRTRGR